MSVLGPLLHSPVLCCPLYSIGGVTEPKASTVAGNGEKSARNRGHI